MKKLGKFLMVGAVAAIAVAGTVGMVACGGNSGYKGEYKYENTYSQTEAYYGAKVTITVDDIKVEQKGIDGKTYTLISDGTITKVTVEADTDNYHNITPSWQENDNEGDLGHDKAAAGLDEYLKKFEGKKLSEIAQIQVETATSGAPVAGQTGDLFWTGATQTSGRIILAVQNAIGDVNSILEGKAPEKGTWAYHLWDSNLKKMGSSIDKYLEALGSIGQ